MARHRERGFTLIELMIVVVIVGVLSVIAVSGWRKHVIAARSAEASTQLGMIRAAQETYFQAYGQYCGLVNPTPWPAVRPEQEKVGWGQPPAGTPWAQLGIKTPGQVWFQYFVAAGPSGNEPAEWPGNIRNRGPWYKAWAENNFDNGPDETYFEVISPTTDVFEGKRPNSLNQ
jgi:prepilin-type N-terminal cleavage/methylation domain-containing protein